MLPTDEYIAGFFDGEGCICIKHDNRHDCHVLSIHISQKRPHVLMLIQRVCGGNVRLFPGNAAHVLTLPPLPSQAFLRRVLPHLIVKKEEAKIALEFCDYQASDRLHTGQPELYKLGVRHEREQFKLRLQGKKRESA